VVVTASTSEAYAFLFKLLADPGDEVLVPSPSYPLFEFLAGLEGVRTVPYPLRYDGEWHLDRTGLHDAVREHPRLRAIVVVSPHNPVGAFLKRDELEFLAGVAGEHGLALVGDEVFSDYPLQAAAGATSVVEQDRALAFLLSGASKVLAAPGLKVGWMLAGGPLGAVEEALQRLEVVADTYLSASTAAQSALPVLLSRREQIQRPLRERLSENLAPLRTLHHAGSTWEPLRAEGGWSVVLRVPTRCSEQEWVLALLEEGVLVQPGYFFDFPRPGYLVLSLLGPPAEFAEGLRRAARVFDAA
jgi:aspartate/methionine/tyrosine aminotransferase